jgi:hypothetical protein
VQASTTVVAKVREEMYVCPAELEPSCHCWKYGTEPFAIPACVTDLHDAADFLLCLRHVSSGDDIVCRERYRLAGQCFKRLHD